MTDSKQNRGTPNSKRIDVNDPNEVRNWSKSLGVSAEKLKEAVAKVGSSTEKVRAHLETNN